MLGKSTSLTSFKTYYNLLKRDFNIWNIKAILKIK